MRKAKTEVRVTRMPAEPDVAERLPDSKAVNDALRALAAVADRKASRPSRRRSARKPARGPSRG